MVRAEAHEERQEAEFEVAEVTIPGAKVAVCGRSEVRHEVRIEDAEALDSRARQSRTI